MDKFEDFFKKSISSSDHSTSSDLPKTKIQRGMVGISRLNQRIVPDSATADMSVNSKVEQLRGRSSTVSIPLSTVDLKQITSDYNITNLSKTAARELGTTGIVIFYDNSQGKFFIKKK